MCSGDEHGHDHHTEATVAAPRPIEGEAVDPIALEAVDEVVKPTVAALTQLAPTLVVPAHWTGWRAQHRFGASLADAFVRNAVGTSFVLAA